MLILLVLLSCLAHPVNVLHVLLPYPMYSVPALALLSPCLAPAAHLVMDLWPWRAQCVMGKRFRLAKALAAS